ncbi:MAG: glycosyltransferase family 4 protein [Verrucomicrobiota bacterium]
MNRSVLFVGAFPRPAALERYVSGDLAARLESHGWQVRVASRAVSRAGRLWDILWHTWRARNEYEIACVDLYSGPAFLWAQAACAVLKRLRKRFVLTLHGGSLPQFARRHPRRVERLLCAAAAVTCPSPYLLAQMRHVRADLILLPNGLDLAKYSFRERRPPFRHLVWLRAFHAIYNPGLAVEVVAKLKPGGDLRLTMIGPDKKDGSLASTKAAAARLGVAGAVSFRGAVAKQDVPNELAEGDIFMNTTNFDNTPVSVLEAMACGLPVVTTNVGGIPYLLEDGQTALLTPPGDAKTMADAVRRLGHEPELASKLGRNARAKVELFSWEGILPKWEELLESLAAGQRIAAQGGKRDTAQKSLLTGPGTEDASWERC